MNIIFGIIVVSIIALFTVGQIKLFYRRYIKSYDSEIEEYLNTHKLTLNTTYYPTKDDWKNSPFKKPPNFSITLSVVKVNGMFVKWNHQNYKVIHTNEGHIVWLEIDTTYFKHPILTFRAWGKIKSKKNKSENGYIHSVQNTCPACGFHISQNDMECPDCGLNFR